ncbi:MAG: class I SAM-dependent methyltransferase [Nitrospirae bacterium]|nr:class I SAM-dependent methyltransferase [Nitrospirota bacterium]
MLKVYACHRRGLKMRKWYKYALDQNMRGERFIGTDEQYSECALAMGGYNPDEAYGSKADFFNKYFFGYHLGRLQCYDNFIRGHLSKTDNTISIASGRGAAELFLLEDGYRITCSDLDITEMLYQETLKLFPQFKFHKLNILQSPTPAPYDALLCLSLIYLFDDVKLSACFDNISRSLSPGGRLILDSAGSPDNFLSYLIHECLLKWETAYLLRAKRLLATSRLDGVVTQHHGYRRTDDEIVQHARQAGLKLLDRQDYAFLTDFKRSFFLNKLIAASKVSETALNYLGKHIPYIRMFCFEKVG